LIGCIGEGHRPGLAKRQTGNRYSADISILMGGTITPALLAIDLLTGTSFTASGNPMLLERSVSNAALAVDNTPEHVVNAAESTVTFTGWKRQLLGDLVYR
jgi:hypothetical protein